MSNLNVRVSSTLAKDTKTTIQAELDKIKDLKINVQKIAFNKIDTSEIRSSIEKEINSALKSIKVSSIKMPSMETDSISKATSKVSNEFRQMEKLAKQLSTLKIRVAGLDTSKNKNELAALETQIKKVKNAYGSLYGASYSKISTDELQKLKDIAFTTADKIDVLKAKLKDNSFASNDKVASLIARINSFLTKNTAITKKARVELEGFVNELNMGNVPESRFNAINQALKQTENNMRGLGKLGASFRNQMKQAAESFTQWVSVSTAIMTLVHKTTRAIGELKEVDTLLTEISKANDKLTKSQLNNIGNQAYDTASRYGLKATDYLSSVREMSRAGYQNADAMAELAVKAQGAGDMTDEVTNSFIVATDKAYQLNGSVEELSRIMDGINYITNHNAINMTELSEGFSIVASTAASFGVEADELTAALATMGSATQQSGSEVARAFRAILLNIRQVSDEEEGIDAEGLTKYEKACNALGVSLKETKNGILQTRDAMDVLEELSEAYNKLDENDLRRTELLNSVGGKVYHVIQKCMTRMNLIAGNPLEPCTTI